MIEFIAGIVLGFVFCIFGIPSLIAYRAKTKEAIMYKNRKYRVMDVTDGDL